MTNAYCGLATFKSRLNLTGTSDDTAMRLLLQNASRVIDRWCGRHFYVKTETRYFDGGSHELSVDDLLAVTTLKVDYDGDQTFETTFAATDYLLYPIHSPTGTLWPKTALHIATNSSQGSFGPGLRRSVEVAGSWGFGDGESATPYSDSGTTLDEDIDASVTNFDLVLGSAVEIGQTLLLDSEQVYVTALSSNTLTVRRGVNGTTGATHTTGATVYVYAYPEPVKEACLMTAARLWKRRDSAYSTTIGAPDMGPVEVWRGLDADVKLMLEPYRRLLIGAA